MFCTVKFMIFIYIVTTGTSLLDRGSGVQRNQAYETLIADVYALLI